VHLLEASAVRLDIDELRRENYGNAGGSGENVAEQLECFRPSTRSDGAHVPDHGALRVKISSDDQQAPPLLILACDGVEQIVVDLALDESA